MNEMTPYRKTSAFFSFSFPSLIAISCILPLSGILFCEIWCVLFAFQKSTTTYCGRTNKAWNFLPSISEATGGLTPQKYVWRIVIALHATPRFVIASGYHNMHQILFEGNGDTHKYRLLSKASYVLHMTEILALVGLSFVSSSEDYEFHKFCFSLFMLCATLHMISLCILHSWGRQKLRYNLSQMERLSLRCKKLLMSANMFFFSLALYFFYRHNKYCENGVYSMFAICEVIVVLTNIVFHGTAVMDFQNSRLFLQDVRDS